MGGNGAPLITSSGPLVAMRGLGTEAACLLLPPVALGDELSVCLWRGQ